MRRFALVVAAGGLLAGGAVAAPPAPDSAARFALRATLEATPPVQADSRFQLRATLQAVSPSRPHAAAGLVLSAVLQPKAGEICYGPGFIFGDGFETLP